MGLGYAGNRCLQAIGPYGDAANGRAFHRRAGPVKGGYPVCRGGLGQRESSRRHNDAHIHPDCDWSCVYYVDCGQPDEGWERNGLFELHDPRTLAQSSKLGGYGFARSMLIDPEPGKLIMFPSWMAHSVHPFYGSGDRVSIAANIKVTGGAHSGMG